MNKYGVIDLGTNTFHLLIVSEKEGQLAELYRERIFIKLAEDGIEKIGPAPYQRGLDGIAKYKRLLDEHQVKHVRAIGTAALRTASNGQQFIEDLKEQTGIEVKIISGDQEALLIHRGVRQAVPLGTKKGLIMDIGGGSVEFIIADQYTVYWAQSFPVGVAVLFKNFHHQNPISKEEVAILKQHLSTTLQPLIKMLAAHQIESLIGASGTFDVIETFLANKKRDQHYSYVPVEDFSPFMDQLLFSTLEKRLAIARLPANRAEMIIVALLLIHFIIQEAKPKNITISAYAMKEGVLQELIMEQLAPE